MTDTDISNKKIALYPGSFDPITNGHLDVLERASAMFDEVVIAVLNHPAKKSFLDIETRLELIRNATINMKNVSVDYFNGLTVEYARSIGAKFLIRGLRTITDFEYEVQLCQTNQVIAPDIDTVFLSTKPEHNFISSSIVRELSSYKTDISKFVPKCVVQYLHKSMKQLDDNKMLKGELNSIQLDMRKALK
ncbi:MAG: pantetheine-phosphate adenylyltransferase [Candidatus Gastranaerophilales bacterium]|nr:pantetheine-phosphate adenylyltransferase [Candidatus Gastranaerophilales bacterium]